MLVKLRCFTGPAVQPRASTKPRACKHFLLNIPVDLSAIEQPLPLPDKYRAAKRYIPKQISIGDEVATATEQRLKLRYCDRIAAKKGKPDYFYLQLKLYIFTRILCSLRSTRIRVAKEWDEVNQEAGPVPGSQAIGIGTLLHRKCYIVRLCTGTIRAELPRPNIPLSSILPKRELQSNRRLSIWR
jgi:hypothetical protein